MFSVATVTETKAILLGSQVTVDGFTPRRKVRVITHAHADHTKDIGKSLSYQETILVTEETAVFLKHTYRSLRSTRKLVVLKPGQTYKVPVDSRRGGYEVIKFVKASHIPGSVQVVVEDEEGRTFGYTGDFKEPGTGTPVLQGLDALVVDATYGCPLCIRKYKETMDEELVRLVLELLGRGPVHVYAYNGKLQEVMELLRLHGVDAPYLLSRREFLIAKDLEKLGYTFGEYFLEGSPEAKEIERDGWYVRFSKFHNFRQERVRGSKVLLDGWQFVPVQKVGPNAWRVGFSDHADLEDLEYYVLESKAGEIIIDASRASAAQWFASRLELYGLRKVSYRPI
ncbi:MBL fold metallo-hydrolase [Ignicoccus hospitalis]|uniref:Exonuclease of the beta-lactamase fold involved in RNA processing-like protein n=1 Tax=Ignicoccus hospitalis (strain KIN4/I / DSM 18386 / JCM 14125) TaxID=453591 RepID=A8AA45_IGNH4|nr:MBL fold metallo-hydrolase [Ignicoccus hospitalis]ABU81797.1 exonuclease of the beta-lactamase fold involved in RNA processing-like protein [Ignicoccus hospitalis KIN4/I]HIH90065.1 hypothetical protein [Desulfurococcaceae archaeon]